MANWGRLLGGALLAGAAAAIFVAERRSPLRERGQAEPRRTVRNLAMGAMSMVVVDALERPVTTALARRAVRRRAGIVQRLPLPPLARDLIGVVLMDYGIYLWHLGTHRIGFLWRFHLVHHLDLDMDASTALRFHLADMALSVPFRAAQVAIVGPSPRALGWWQRFFFLSIWFHHSNWRLPGEGDRRLAWLLTTPRMHTIHHSTRREETDSNWSSGLSLWDRLHGTFRLDVPPRAVRIGVPAYRRTEDVAIEPSLRLPFVRQRDAWARPPQESVSR